MEEVKGSLLDCRFDGGGGDRGLGDLEVERGGGESSLVASGAVS